MSLLLWVLCFCLLVVFVWMAFTLHGQGVELVKCREHIRELSERQAVHDARIRKQQRLLDRLSVMLANASHVAYDINRRGASYVVLIAPSVGKNGFVHIIQTRVPHNLIEVKEVAKRLEHEYGVRVSDATVDAFMGMEFKRMCEGLG